MPLETASIIGNIKPVQIDNPLDVQGKVLSLSALRDAGTMNQMKLDEARRGQEETLTLNDLYKGAVNPDGTMNRQAVLSGAAQRGLGSRIPTLQKGFADADKATADAEKDRVATLKTKFELTSGAISSLLSRPQVTQNDVIGTIAQLVQNKVIDPLAGEQMVQQVNQQTNPANLRNWLIGKGMESMDASKRMELALPKTDLKDTGGGYAPVQINQLTGQVTAGAPVLGKTQSPDSIASNSLGRDRLNFDKQQGANQFIPVDGVGVFVGDKRTGQARPVVGPDGKPLVSNKAPTESETKAATLYSRMKFSEKQLQNALKGDPGAAKPDARAESARKIPWVGEVSANSMQSEARQRVDSAQLDILDAALTLGTGAAYTREQLEGYRKSFFPQIGDSAQTVADKQERLQNVIASAELAAGRAGPRANSLPGPTANAAPTAPGVAPGLDAAAIAAELARRAAAKGAK